MENSIVSLELVWGVLVETLGVDNRPGKADAATPLFGVLPELDSIGVVALVNALEEEFRITVEDEDVSVETFETLGSLTALVEAKAGAD